MDVDAMLNALKKMANEDPSLREALMATRSAANPLSAFCAIVLTDVPPEMIPTL